eukprot:SAG31_NODE_19991_length_586_cov_4.117043_1_plen_86_part_10
MDMDLRRDIWDIPVAHSLEWGALIDNRPGVDEGLDNGRHHPIQRRTISTSTANTRGAISPRPWLGTTQVPRGSTLHPQSASDPKRG